MAEDFSNKQLSRLNVFPKVEVKTELLSLGPCDDDSKAESDQFVEELIWVKREEDNLFTSDSDDEGKDKDVAVSPDIMEASDLNSSVDPLKYGSTIPSSQVIKTEQPIVLDNLYDESEYQDEETDNNLGFNYNDDPVDTMVDLNDSGLNLNHKEASKNNDQPKKDKTYEKQVGSHFHCTICNVNFKYKKSFSKHIQFSHLNKKESTTRRKNKNAKSQKTLKPSTSSKKKTWFPCENCDEVFPQAKQLGKHQSSVHSIPDGILPKYKCEPCDMLFWKTSSFMNHNRTKHKLRKNKERIAALRKEKTLRLKKQRSKKFKSLEKDNSSKISGLKS